MVKDRDVQTQAGNDSESGDHIGDQQAEVSIRYVSQR